MGLSVLLVSTATAGGTFFHNDWESTDWINIGLMLPAPGELCGGGDDEDEEEDTVDETCSRITSAPMVVRIEVGRFRYTTYQWNIASGSVGMDWNGREHIRVGLGGFGAHWRTGNPNQEVGVMFQLLSLFMGANSWGNTNTNLYFRHNYATHFLEVGVDFSLYWVTSPLGNSKPWGGGLEGFPLHAYISVGM